MTTQPEQILENNLIKQLVGMSYEPVAVHDEASLLANLKAQIEAHNGVSLSAGDIPEAFNVFWEEEQKAAFRQLAEEEGLEPDKLEKLIGDYLFTGKKPLRNEMIEAMTKKPGLRDRASTAERMIEKIYRFMETFINDL